MIKLEMPHKGHHYTQGHVLDRINVGIGYPPRATTGSYHVSVGEHEVGTPKMDADSDRVLMDRNGNVYNRKTQEYTRMDKRVQGDIHDCLLQISHSTVQWWDLEYSCRHKRACIIDVCDGSIVDYHTRRNLVDAPTIDPFVSMIDMPWLVTRFPVWDEVHAQDAFDDMKNAYEHFVEINTANQYNWEGVVVVDATLPYDLTRKQSMNLGMHRKYKFR